MHCSPAPQISSKISFLCCSGAEHYVNLVIGIGPSPLYGPLSSRSTWLGKEDGMKINEGRRIQEGLPPSLSLSLSLSLSPQHFLQCGDIGSQAQAVWFPSVHPSPRFFPPPSIACFNLWTLDPVLLCSWPPARPRLWLMSVQQSLFSSFWFEGKKKGTGVEREGGRSLQNRFSNAIGGGCQRSGVAGEPFMPFHLKKPKGSWRVHSVCVPLLLLMGSALLLAAAYRSAAFYFTSGAHAKKPSSDPEWKKNALMDIYHCFFSCSLWTR